MSPLHATDKPRDGAPYLRGGPLAPRLRTATAAHHRAVEALPALARLLDPRLDRGGYAATLRGLWQAQAACEQALLAAAQVWRGRGLDWDARLCKRRWLQQDLSALGVPAPTVSPAASDRLALTDLARCAGALYVLEGATLGGRVIGKALRHNPRVPPDAQRYFTGYAEATAERWSSFRAQLDGLGPWDEPAVAAAAQAACATFDLFACCLREEG